MQKIMTHGQDVRPMLRERHIDEMPNSRAETESKLRVVNYINEG